MVVRGSVPTICSTEQVCAGHALIRPKIRQLASERSSDSVAVRGWEAKGRMTTRRCSRHQSTRATSCRASSGATRTCPSAPILPTPRPDKTRWLRWRCVLRTATAAVHLTHSCAAASCTDCTAVAAVRQPHRKRLPGASGALLTGRGACALRTYGPAAMVRPMAAGCNLGTAA
jgi:hypothetical protein